MAQPQSLIQSFSAPLPDYTYRGAVKKAPASKSKTKRTPPPHFAVRRNPNDRWSHRGNNYLLNLQAAGTPPQAAGHALFSHFNNERLYQKEDAILHRNEADVVRTAAMYLIHPVCQALNAHPAANKAFSSQCEDASVDGVRTDITYFKPGAGGNNRAFAVVEYKRRTVVKSSELDAAVRTYDPAAATAAADLARIQNALPPVGRGQTHPSFFMGDSHRLLKQASAYAIEHRTRYVALFDYDHLVCLYFPQLDHNAASVTSTGNNVSGNYVEIDVYPFSESNQMRKALLGFLEDAFVNTPP